MTYDEAMLFIEESSHYGSVLGLDSMRRLLEGLGNPQNNLKFVHVAGTNGKGSTAAYLANIIGIAGYRVGRYISPSVFEYKEIIEITKKNTNDLKRSVITEYISEDAIAACISKIKPVCSQMVQDNLPHPTIFEVETAMAMLYFLQEKCDVVVLEVGLGGRLDATNVIETVLCSVITSISMDHMSILGNTLELIATEKAGIIKENIPVVSYDQEAEAGKVIELTSRRKNSKLIVADFHKIEIKEQGINGTTFSYDKLGDFQIQMLGENQVKNAVLSMLTIKILKELGYQISDKDIKNGLYLTKWRGRFDIINRNPLFLVDGAHNEDAAKSLAKNIEIYFAKKRIIYIMGVLADKDCDAVLKYTGSYAERIITITPNNARGLESAKLANIAKKYCKQVIDASNVGYAVKSALETANEEDVIIAFGSLSYLSEVYDCIKEL